MPQKRHKCTLVTGGAGFIGSHAVDAFIKTSKRVIVVDDLSHGNRSNLNPKADFYKMSITSPSFVSAIKKWKPEIIAHIAAQQDVRKSIIDPKHDAQVNVFGTLNVIEGGVACGVKKFIFTSSGGAIYPAYAKLPIPETVCDKPVSPYGISKRAAELYFVSNYEILKIPYVNLRLANVYGPRQAADSSGGVVSIFLERIMSGKQIVINGDGKQTRDYVFVEDVIDAILRASSKSAVGTCNISTGLQTDLNEVYTMICSMVGCSVKPKYGQAKKGEVLNSALDPRWASKLIGWKPKTNFEEGLRKTVAWYAKSATIRAKR